MSPAPKVQKTTIYVDSEEEITSIIDKVRSSDESIIALVLPKRAPTFLSAVNIKLLKRAATQSHKKIVLITSNQNILPLAGLAGIHVAHNLNSRPYVPSGPDNEVSDPSETDQSIEIDSAPKSESALHETAKKTGKQPSKAAAPTDAKHVKKKAEVIETIDMSAQAAEVSGSTSRAKKSKKTKLKVPNFNKFRLVLIVGGVMVVSLVVFGYWALAIAPKATVTIKGETKTASLAFVLKANTTATALNEETSEVPAKIREIKKTETERVPATGQKDVGNKASGTMSLKNCSRSDGSVNIPAGTGVSAGDVTFITQASVALDPSEFTGGGTCKSDSKEVAVIAQTAGDKYNVSSRTYTVAGFSGVTATGSAMTGGTSQLVKVVAEADIESAKTKLSAKQAGATEELKAGLDAEGYVALVDTFEAAPGNFVPTPQAGAEANEVAVSVETKYTMTGIKKDELKQLVKVMAGKQGGVDLAKQIILDDGLSNAGYQLGAKTRSVTDVTMKTNVIAGPEIKPDSIKAEIAGQKRGVAEQTISSRPGIKEVRVETSPFWSYSVPKKLDKINVIVEEANGNQIKP